MAQDKVERIKVGQRVWERLWKAFRARLRHLDSSEMTMRSHRKFTNRVRS